MSMTDRDRKILLLIVPAVILAAYWFLLMSPKRDEAATAGQELTAQEQRRDDAQARAASLSGARTDFAADYSELVRLGKAVPTSVDMPTVLVQLDDAARGTDIKFIRITAQEREAAAATTAAPPGSDTSGSDPATAGGAPAQSAPGAAGESAGNAVSAANSSSASAEQSGLAPGDAQTSQPANDGSLPIGGGSVAPDGTPIAGSAVPGLDTVGLELEFTGNFLDLSDFFHRIKRYVEVDNENLNVRGRLLTVDGVEFKSEPDLFPRITATLNATVYLAPEIEGATAGATPSGPAEIPAATSTTAVPMATSTPTDAAR
jgi:hypothetical protein